MKTIDWNQISELGLLEKINREIMHPIGLALSRNPETGVSERALVADDGVWEYAEGACPRELSPSEFTAALERMTGFDRGGQLAPLPNRRMVISAFLDYVDLVQGHPCDDEDVLAWSEINDRETLGHFLEAYLGQ